MIGQTLSHFKITAKLGEGGMGEVYRANDTRLDREVAIKVLPEAFVANSERLARFEREAKALAALDHPNIAGIYEIGEHDGTHFLAMQLVEGEDLAARLDRGRLSVEDAYDLALQIAHALEAAHGKGIVHRDLKPGNIMVGSDGTVRVLDFGLAKTVEADSDETALSHSPTLTTPMTETGVILGTAAYMSPEQAKGLPVDSRTDIWAFGCVLYEMLTGKRPFAGRTVTETLAAVLEREVDWTALPESLPSLARSVLRRCLEKDPKRRLHDVADARIELEEAIREPALGQEGFLPAAAVRSAVRQGVFWTLASLALAAALGTAGWFWTRPEPGPAPIRRFDLDPPAGVLMSEASGFGGSTLAVSPDGERVAFRGYSEDPSAPTQLYLRSVEELETRPVPGTEDGNNAFFSPNSRWMGFHSRGAIRKVPLAGGEPLVICEASRLRGASWAEDGSILFSAGEGLLWVSAEGGEPEVVTTPEASDRRLRHYWPHHLPGGRAALFVAFRGAGEANNQIAVLSLETGEQRTLLRGGAYPRYADGNLVYSRLGTLYAAPFDLEQLELTGEPRPVLDDVNFHLPSGAVAYDLSRTGTLVFNKGAERLRDAELVQVDRQGKVSPLVERRAPYLVPPVFSPDGRRFAVLIQSSLQEVDLWTYEPERDLWERLTSDGGIKGRAVWTPDGASILFSSARHGAPKIFRLAADGSGTPEQLTTGLEWDYPTSISPDGRVLLFMQLWAPASWTILMLPLEGEDRAPRPFLGPPADEAQAVFSPDGRWVAYVSWESGRGEIYVQRYPGPGRKVRISAEGGLTPQWNPNGRELFYRFGQTIWAVAVETEPAFVAGRSAPLVENWDSGFRVSPDGQRFLSVKYPEEDEQPLRLIYVPSWTEELKQAVSRGAS